MENDALSEALKREHALGKELENGGHSFFKGQPLG